jgi:hypothetical protein
MPGWTKIAGLLALSVFAGLMGAACTGEVKKTAEAPAVEVAAVDAPRSTNLDPVSARGPSMERRRCGGSCLDRFDRCMRGRGRERERACRRDRHRCMTRCRRF